jgi:hypothetical protein
MKVIFRNVKRSFNEYDSQIWFKDEKDEEILIRALNYMDAEREQWLREKAQELAKFTGYEFVDETENDK